MFQCRIRPMHGHAQHTVAGFQFLRDPRPATDKRESGKPDEYTGVRLHIVDPGREIIVDERARQDIDEPGRPLVICGKTYETLKSVAGVSLLIEPIANEDEARKVDVMAKKLADARVAAAEEDTRKIKAALEGENKSLAEQLADAQAKVAQFEEAFAKAKETPAPKSDVTQVDPVAKSGKGGSR